MNRSLVKVVATLGVSFSLLFGSTQINAATPKALTVHYIDVGQGDSIYIKTPAGEDILIDAGRQGDKIVSYLNNLKVDDIEILISTHPDADQN